MASSSDGLGSAGEREGLTAQEAQLAQLAAEGDGAAFATLYDRYEGRIFNFCQRLLGSPDDAADATQEAFLKVLQRLPKLGQRELNFSAYLYTAARNASYDMIGRRKKAQPVEELPERGGGEGEREPGDLLEDPERAAMLGSLRSEIRVANDRLPERQREVLALRELEDLSYDDIAEVMGMNRNSVAQLISRARINLRDELRGSALASLAAASPDCERALPLIALRDDGQLADGADHEWLDAHLAACDTCGVAEEAMQEAGTSYRGWLPLVPFLWLRRDTIAQAGELVGSNWSQVAGSPPPEDPGPGGGEGPGGGGTADTGAGGTAGETPAGAGGGRSRRRRRAAAVLTAAFALLLGLFVAVVVGDEDPPAPAQETTPASEPAGTVTTEGPKATPAKKKAKTQAGAEATTEPPVTTKTTPSGKVITVADEPTPTRRRRTARRRNTGAGGGGGGGPVSIPDSGAPPTTTQSAPPPPPTTQQEPPPPTTTEREPPPRPPPCRPGIRPCPRP